MAIDLVGFGILFPVLARYARDTGASPAVAGMLVASFSIAQVIFSPLTGLLSDRVGRKPVIILSLVGTAIGSLLTGLAGSLALLFVGRIIDGASGSSVAVAQASVTDVAEPSERARLLGLLGAAFGVGFALGPAIGGIAALVSHRLPFFIAAAIAGVNALVAVKRLPETLDRSTIERGASKPAARPGVDTGSRELVRRLILVTFTSLVAFSGFEATFSLLTEARLDLSESATYAVFFLIGIGLVFVQGGLVHPVVASLGETRTVRAGLVADAVGLALVAVDAGWWSLAPALVFLVVGQGLVAPTLSSLVSRASPEPRRGQTLGLQHSAGGLARAVGPALAGVLFGAAVAAPYVLGAALLVLSVALLPAAMPEKSLAPVTRR